MFRLSIPQRPNVKRRCILFCFLTSLFALVFALTGSQFCEAQSVPLMIDTHFYKKRTPTPPTFGDPSAVIDIQEKVLPSGQRVKTYQYTPSAQIINALPGSRHNARSAYRPPYQITNTLPKSRH